MKYLLILSAFLLAACEPLKNYKCIDGVVYTKLDDNVWIKSPLYGPECRELK